MKNLGKLGWALIGAEVTCIIGAIYSYGQVRYYKGKIDAVKEIKQEVEKVQKEFEEKHGVNIVKEEAK